jgi:hypothetical protein
MVVELGVAEILLDLHRLIKAMLELVADRQPVRGLAFIML